MPRKKPKPESLAYKVKKLAFHYTTCTISKEGFKRELQGIMDEFSWQGSLLQQNVGASLCKWLMEYKWLADKHDVDIRGVCELANEVEPKVGEHLERWKKLET